MVEILIRFRAHMIAITADIEKAYHQVQLHEEDRDFVRFFWIKNVKDAESDMEVYRFKVIPFGANSSSFILLSVIKNHLSCETSEVAKDMDVNIYVDNLLAGCNTTEEALTYYKEANFIFQKSGLKLKSWSSNNQHLNSCSASDGVNDGSAQNKILGLQWSRARDVIALPELKTSSFSLTVITKRNVLRGISTVYDPLGFLSPLTIPAKILIQDVWKLKLQWDDPLPIDLQDR
ncbi:uncharacterized protein LOC130701903 [Daphnia carinata]|uniref:uncharacterized protein LOC130701903 n=1 Tax=Daphnia carinata TaxID=120202 RepID=UPI00257A2F21|nr:uncharacterized protein LOC130701903 [Daphnia carinata]